MANKPKSRRHEDRIKALEESESWREPRNLHITSRITALENQLDFMIRRNRRKWWQFWK